MKTTWMNTVAAFAAFAMGTWVASPAQQVAGSAAGKADKNPVHEISLPQYPLEMPPGPNLAVFQQHCLLCHGGRYVTMQPRFSRAVWEKEVKKMVDAYGAPITPTEQTQIVEYLTAIKGPAETK
jgi:cytochrome c5